MKLHQYLYVSPRAPFVLAATGLFLLAPVIPNAIWLAQYAIGSAAPSDPASSSELASRVGMVMGSMLVGGAVIVAAVVSRRWLNERQLRKTLYPDQPWLWRAAWTEHRIGLNTVLPAMALLLVILLASIVFVATGVTVAEQGWEDRNPWLPIVTAIVVFVAVRMYRVNRRWRRSEVRLVTLPGVVGGPFEAVVVLSARFPPGTPFRLTLQCEQASWSRHHARDSRDRVKTLWQADTVIDRHLETKRPDATALLVYFAIPYDCPSTIIEPDRRVDPVTTINWWLTVRLKDDEHFRSVRFEVPVFKTAESSPSYQHQPGVFADYEQILRSETALQTVRHRIERLPQGGERLHFSLLRWDFAAILAVLIVFSLAGLVAALACLRPWPLAAVAAVVPAIMLIAAIVGIVETLLWRCSITLTSDRLQIASGYLGFAKTATVGRDGALRLAIEVEFRDDESDRRRLALELADGRRLTIIKRLRGRQEAEVVRKRLAARLGISDTEGRTNDEGPNESTDPHG